MLRWFRQRTELRLIGQQLYDGIVAQARSVAFYRDLRVPDTMEGRFEMITLHL
jgi:cytochrome b pre-mRNA-processing protein 3